MLLRERCFSFPSIHFVPAFVTDWNSVFDSLELFPNIIKDSIFQRKTFSVDSHKKINSRWIPKLFFCCCPNMNFTGNFNIQSQNRWWKYKPMKWKTKLNSGLEVRDFNAIELLSIQMYHVSYRLYVDVYCVWIFASRHHRHHRHHSKNQN